MTTIAPEPHYAHKDGVIYYDRKFRMSRSVALVVLDDWRKEYRRAFNAHDMRAASAAIRASNDLAAALEEQARWVKAWAKQGVLASARTPWKASSAAAYAIAIWEAEHAG